MGSKPKANVGPAIVMASGLVGTLASIVALPSPTRFWVAGLLAGVVIAAAGYVMGHRTRPALTAIARRPDATLERELGAAKEVWFAWHTGSVKVAQGDLFHNPRKIRLVITDPDCQALQEVGKIGNLRAAEMAPGIRALTSDAKKAGAVVSWFDGFIANSMVIANPDGPDGWARLEVLVPFGDPASRPSIVVEASRHPELFERLKTTFRKLEAAAKTQ